MKKLVSLIVRMRTNRGSTVGPKQGHPFLRLFLISTTVYSSFESLHRTVPFEIYSKSIFLCFKFQLYSMIGVLRLLLVQDTLPKPFDKSWIDKLMDHKEDLLKVGTLLTYFKAT